MIRDNVNENKLVSTVKWVGHLCCFYHSVPNTSAEKRADVENDRLNNDEGP
jgi:hypothetical protein